MPTLMSPSFLIEAGTWAASALSTDDPGATVALSPPDELPPHADTSPVTMTAVRTAMARVALSLTGPSRVVALADILPVADRSGARRAVTRFGHMPVDRADSPVFILHKGGKLEVTS